jgi:hypothetical protein
MKNQMSKPTARILSQAPNIIGARSIAPRESFARHAEQCSARRQPVGFARVSIKHHLLPVAVGVAALVFTGCKSIDQGPFQSFAASADKVNTSAQAAYNLLAQTGVDRAKQQLVASPLPPYMPPNNRELLLGKTFISDDSFQERAKVTGGLAAYAHALANLASDPAQQQFDTSTAGLAQALKNFQGDDATKLFGPKVSQVLPTPSQVDAFSGAVQTIGNLILEAETKRDLKEVLQKGTPAILCVTTNLENDIGLTTKTGMRGYFDAYYDGLLVDQFGQKSWVTDGKTVVWADLPPDSPVRQKMVQDAFALEQQRRTTDALLVTLQQSYGKLRQAHEALKGVVSQSQQFSLSNALATFNEAAQNLDDIVNSLKKTK